MIIVLYFQVIKVINNLIRLVNAHDQESKQAVEELEEPMVQSPRSTVQNESILSFSTVDRDASKSHSTNKSRGKPGLDDSMIKLTDLGDDEQLHKINVLYQIKRDDFNQNRSKPSALNSEETLAIPIGNILGQSYRSAKVPKIEPISAPVEVSLNKSEDVKAEKPAVEINAKPADWRLKEIKRNMNFAFIALLILMSLMDYISVIYLLHVWQINPLDTDQFRFWDIASIVAQIGLCLLFLYYYYKMKSFYSVEGAAKE